MVFCGFSFKAFLLGVSCTSPMYLGDLFFVTKLYISFFVYPKKKGSTKLAPTPLVLSLQLSET